MPFKDTPIDMSLENTNPGGVCVQVSMGALDLESELLYIYIYIYVQVMPLYMYTYEHMLDHAKCFANVYTSCLLCVVHDWEKHEITVCFIHF